MKHPLQLAFWFYNMPYLIFFPLGITQEKKKKKRDREKKKNLKGYSNTFSGSA
jgi:hypothetical protein